VLGDGAVWVAVNHAGPASGLYRSADGARSFEHQVMGLPTVLGLASAAGSLWAATESGLFAIDPRASAKSAARLVEEVGARRVDQVVAEADRVVVRSGGELFERRPNGRFERLLARSPTAPAPVASIAFAAGALWASDEGGLVRMRDGERRAIAAPVRNGHLESLGSALALNGGDSLWLRSDLESPWQEVATGHPRLLPTGDGRWPALVVVARPDGAAAEFELRLAEAGAAGWTWRRLEVPVPERDVRSALVVGDRLVLATSGYGVVTRSLAP
jgi:ligand-binding sensor domain-containing protein